MPHEKTVKEIMLPLEECPTVSPEDTIQHAVTLLKKGAVSGHQYVLVMKNKTHPIGLLSRRLLLRAIEPNFVVTDQWSLPVLWKGFFTDKCREESQKKVKEIMRPTSFFTVEADDPIIKAVHIMVDNHVGMLPVMQKDKMIGILRIREIFHEIACLVAES